MAWNEMLQKIHCQNDRKGISWNECGRNTWGGFTVKYLEVLWIKMRPPRFFKLDIQDLFYTPAVTFWPGRTSFGPLLCSVKQTVSALSAQALALAKRRYSTVPALSKTTQVLVLSLLQERVHPYTFFYVTIEHTNRWGKLLTFYTNFCRFCNRHSHIWRKKYKHALLATSETQLWFSVKKHWNA